MLVRFVTTPSVDPAIWSPPIGIAQLAGSLQSVGIDTHCLDLNPDFSHGVWIPTEVLGFEPEIEGAHLLRKIWSDTVSKWAQSCLDGSPDFIGISVLYAGMVVPSLALAYEIKSRNPSLPICFGGPFASPSNYQVINRLLQSQLIDGILQGDGEVAIQQIVQAIKHKTGLNQVPGMWTQHGNGAIMNIPPQLIDPNTLPFADFRDFDLRKYQNLWHGCVFPISGSRGCVNKCSFCNSRKRCPKFLQRSAEHIFEEIKRDIELYDIQTLAFTDNLINGNPRELKKLCRLIINAKLNLRIWGMIALMPSVDEEMLDLLNEAGFSDLSLGFESPAPKVREDMGKWSDMEGVMSIIRGLVKRSMKPSINLMHSFPTERDKDFEQLLHFVDEFVPSDFNSVQYFPFRLTLVQPGEIEMAFVKQFGLHLESTGYGYDTRNPRIAFGKEPFWTTEYINDFVRIERQYRLHEHITQWYHKGSQCHPETSAVTLRTTILSLLKQYIKHIPKAIFIGRRVKKLLRRTSTFLIALVIFIYFMLSTSAQERVSSPNSHREQSKNASQDQQEKPHIIILLADDLGWNDISLHGSEIQTPNIDSLGKSGVELNQFYVAPVCTPTRASLLTGKYALRTGLHYGVLYAYQRQGLPLEQKTFAQILKDKGDYKTTALGKWHLGHHQVDYLPTRRGFDHFYGHYTGGIDYFSHKYLGILDWHRNETPIVEDGYATDLIGQEAVSIIESHDISKPLLMYVAFYAPHTPLQAPQTLIEQYSHIQNPGRRTYAAMVTAMDNAIGHILNALEKRGIRENTLIFFTSDNGGAFYSFADNRPFRGYKGTLYEGGIRVPAFFVWPAMLKKGQIMNEPVHIVDIFPTLANVAEISLDSTIVLDGMNILPYIREQKPLPRKEILLHFVEKPFSAAIRRGKWKLVLNAESALYRQDWPENPYYSQVELFNLEEDVYERVNQAFEYPELVEELQQRIQSYAQYALPPVGTFEAKPPVGFHPPKVWGPWEEPLSSEEHLPSSFLKKTITHVRLARKRTVATVSFLLGIGSGVWVSLIIRKLKNR